MLEKVRSLCESGYSPADIGILYRRKEQRDDNYFRTLLKRLDDMGLRPYWVTQDMETKTPIQATAPGIRIITALSSLRLRVQSGAAAVGGAVCRLLQSG
jgi:hypothetical protein